MEHIVGKQKRWIVQYIDGTYACLHEDSISSNFRTNSMGDATKFTVCPFPTDWPDGTIYEIEIETKIRKKHPVTIENYCND